MGGKRKTAKTPANKQYYVVNHDSDRAVLDDLSYNNKGTRKNKGRAKIKDTKDANVIQKPIDPEWSPSPYSAFKLILSARFAAALWMSISDCDETFNYWEPTHYLLFGKGFQTWEYSPVYALRSYTYILIHAVPAKIYEAILKPHPLLVFFFLRCFLSLISAFSEVYLYRAVRNTFGGNVSRISLVASLFSAGMFISSSAYLPSAFSNYMTSFAIGAWMSNRDELAIFCIALSALLSWPFAALTGAFIAFDIVIIRRQFTLFLKWAILSFVVILVPIVAIDSSYYGKTVIAPLNIVLYNIFSTKGPDLYGTEPWTFYLINGVLNFNIMFIGTLMSPIVLLLSLNFHQNIKQKIIVIATVFLWLAVFIVQPHKEERFLFPIYSLIPVCGAIAVDSIQKILDLLFSKIFIYLLRANKKFSAYFWDYRRFVTRVGFIAILLTSLLGCSRILALHYGFRAPFDLYFHLQRESSTQDLPFLNVEKTLTLCYGKEWHRYPTSFLVPSIKWDVRFIQSEFRGQLPGHYPPHNPNGTQLIPPHMNDNNEEEFSRYVQVEECDFLVDLIVDSDRVTAREPNYAARTNDWKIISEHPYLNSAKSHPLFRAFYVPLLSAEHTTYDRYVFLLNKQRAEMSRASAKTKIRGGRGKEFLEEDDIFQN